ERKSESRRQTFGYVDPVVAAVVASIDAAVILLVQDVAVGRMSFEMMDALPYFRKLVGHEVGAHAGVLRRPARAVVVCPERARRRHAHGDARSCRRIERDRVDHEPAGAGRPLRARGMVGERADLGPVLTRILADKERAGIDAGVEPAGLPRICLDGPDALDGVSAAFLETNARRRVTPGAAQVLGHLNSGSEPPALARDDH